MHSVDGLCWMVLGTNVCTSRAAERNFGLEFVPVVIGVRGRGRDGGDSDAGPSESGSRLVNAQRRAAHPRE